jgi:hypothetical protein
MHAEMNGASELSRQMQRRVCPHAMSSAQASDDHKDEARLVDDGVVTARPGSAVARRPSGLDVPAWRNVLKRAQAGC